MQLQIPTLTFRIEKSGYDIVELVEGTDLVWHAGSPLTLGVENMKGGKKVSETPFLLLPQQQQVKIF